MIVPNICDMCGDLIEGEKTVTLSLANVMMANPHRVMVRKEWFLMEVTERRDDFHLCQECGASLSLALHTSRSTIKVAVVKMEDPV